MASLESLPADQRAVLQLVLQRGRSYDEIARLLSIDRSAVRQRAVSAVEALGPQTGLEGERRQVITDYLLGQLDSGAATAAQNEIAAAPGERAWARVVASELNPLASSPLPAIPAAAAAPPPPAAAPPAAAPPPAAPPPAAPPPAAPPAAAAPAAEPTSAKPARQSIFPSKRRLQASDAAAPEPEVSPREEGSGRSSVLGGGVLIVLTAIIVAAVVVFLLNSGGSSPTPAASTSSSSTAAPAASSTPTASGTTTSGSSSAAKVVAQINLTPTASGGKAAGIAEVLKEGTSNGIAIVGQNVTPNTKTPPTAYAVWLYNSPTDAHILGFVNPGVTATGRLSTAGGLPTNAARYKQLIVTLETKASPKTPGTIILQGTLTGLSS